MLKNKWLLWALVIAVPLNVGLLVTGWQFGRFGDDFEVFWTAANSQTPYAASDRPFASPPTALLAFQTLRLTPYLLGFALWTTAGVAAFYAVAGNIYGQRAALLAVIGPASVGTLIAGQVSLLASALVLWSFAATPVVSGVLLAVVLCLKPQFAFLAPAYLLFMRRWDTLASFFAAALAFALAATVAFGPSVWWDWLNNVGHLALVVSQWGAMWSVSAAKFGVPLVLTSGLAIGVLYLARNVSRPFQAPLVVACSLLASPYALFYDLAAVAPLAAFLMLRGDRLGRPAGMFAYSAMLGPLSAIAVGIISLSRREGALKGSALHDGRLNSC